MKLAGSYCRLHESIASSSVAELTVYWAHTLVAGLSVYWWKSKEGKERRKKKEGRRKKEEERRKKKEGVKNLIFEFSKSVTMILNDVWTLLAVVGFRACHPKVLQASLLSYNHRRIIRWTLGVSFAYSTLKRITVVYSAPRLMAYSCSSAS